jgi:hypothetical protein
MQVALDEELLTPSTVAPHCGTHLEGAKLGFHFLSLICEHDKHNNLRAGTVTTVKITLGTTT